MIETAAQLPLRVAASNFRTPTVPISVWQLISGFVPLVAIFAVMYAALLSGVSYWLIAPLSILAGGLIVRIFIFQHDCGHGSFFRSRAANHWVGIFCSLVTLTPFENWRRKHAGHHMNWNSLDNRNDGLDIYSTCLTLEEFRQLRPMQKLYYRAVWNPFIGLIVLPPAVFLMLYRFNLDTPKTWSRERRSVWITNGFLALFYGLLVAQFGFWTVVLVHVPATAFAAIFGVLMFSLQHRFEAAVWARDDEWTPEMASLKGTSHLDLPKVLQWFTGNIGFHHIHHLDPAVPNYRLEECHRSDARFQAAPKLSIWQGFSAIRFCLWDETQKRLVPIPSR